MKRQAEEGPAELKDQVDQIDKADEQIATTNAVEPPPSKEAVVVAEENKTTEEVKDEPVAAVVGE